MNTLRKTILIACFVLIASLLRAADPVTWRFALQDKGNGTVELSAMAAIQDGWHIYGTELPDGGPNATEMTVGEIRGAVKTGGLKARGATLHKAFDPAFQMELGYYEGTVSFVQLFLVTDKSAFLVSGEVRAQACDESSCTPPLPVEFKFTRADLPAGFKAAADNSTGSAPATASVAGTAPETDGTDAALAEPASVNAAPDAGQDLWVPVIDELRDLGAAGSTADMTLLWIFLFGFAGGFLALLTPCVWPMIPMTVSFFIKRASNRKRAVRDALVYGAAIIVIYVGLGLIVTGIFGASALNEMSTSAIFNLIFFALLVLFAASFFGAFELTLPAKWTNKMDSKAGTTSGLLSIFFMAFTLVLVSFSCTGPVIGWLLVEAASSGAVIAPAIGMLGFAIALAIPFGLFAMFPSWLNSMPKSGGWLNSVKVVLGFLELALALKFLSVADLAYGWGILDREVFLVLWIVIFAMLGFYLLGKIKLPHDSDLKHVSVVRLMLAIVSFAFSVYMVPGLWGAPLKAISAFSPPLYTQDFSLYKGEVHAAFDDYDSGMEYARRTGKPVAIDFSGYGCVNCRKMEASVWTDPRVKQILEKDYVLITLMVDDKTRLPAPVEVEEGGRTVRLKTVGDKWSYLQRHKFGVNSQPYYVLLDGNGMPVAPSYAFDPDVGKYLRFLQQGLDGYRNKRQ